MHLKFGLVYFWTFGIKLPMDGLGASYLKIFSMCFCHEVPLVINNPPVQYLSLHHKTHLD